MDKLDTRKKEILKAVIQSYIDLNTPIGSLLISRTYPIDLSPATIRSIMASLEDMGYISQPHTSAGRIPTEKGYQYYIDCLMQENTFVLTPSISEALSSRFRSIEHDSNALIKEATKTLSAYSRYLAIATPLKPEDVLLQKIKFIKHDRKKVLAVVISDEGVIRNSVIELDRSYAQKQLDRASDYLNSSFSGLSIRKVREKIAYELYREKTICDDLIANLLHLCKDIVPLEDDSLALNSLGTANLADFATMKQIKSILHAIEDKRFLLKILQKMSETPGTQVFVGMETLYPSLGELTLVISTYKKQKTASGALGIIGPTRMNYRRMIPVVDHTAKELTKRLSTI